VNVAILSEADLKGSGYTTIMTRFAGELVERGDRVVFLGIGYEGQQHSFSYPIVPIMRPTFYKQGFAAVHNLFLDEGYRPDVILVGLDIPMQITMSKYLKDYLPRYVGLFPVEAPPIGPTWAAGISGLKERLVMSKFGVKACEDAYLTAKFFPVPVDTQAWRPPSADERALIRTSLGFRTDEKVVLTVAENQERKNLFGTLRIIQEAHKGGVPIRHILVTKRYSNFGWSIDDLLMELGLMGVVLPFEKGIPFKKLWALYAAADAMLITSKAEGLGMPVLEAMSVGVPVVAPAHSAFVEHLDCGRGYLFGCEYVDRGVFGNEYRYFASVDEGADVLTDCLQRNSEEVILKAHEYIDARKWEAAVEVFHEAAR
jgi:glycosyltransferase involved in cell wall biosynthesis